MKGPSAICPESGATLSEQRHYTSRGRPLRAPENDQSYGDDAYALTTGEAVSSTVALMNFVRRMHERHHEPDDELYQRIALALRRLKADSDTRDEWVLYALAQRLADHEIDVEWLRAHLEPVCPRCGGRLAYESTVRGLQVRCGIRCGGDYTYRNLAIRRQVRDTYNQAFPDEAIDRYEVTVL